MLSTASLKKEAAAQVERVVDLMAMARAIGSLKRARKQSQQLL